MSTSPTTTCQLADLGTTDDNGASICRSHAGARLVVGGDLRGNDWFERCKACHAVLFVRLIIDRSMQQSRRESKWSSVFALSIWHVSLWERPGS